MKSVVQITWPNPTSARTTVSSSDTISVRVSGIERWHVHRRESSTRFG
jgi:hypothetical protein